MKWRIGIGFLAAFALLYLFTVFVGQRAVFSALTTVSIPVFLLGFVAIVVSLAFRSLVWVRFLKLADVTLSTRRIVLLFLSGMFLKYVTPYGQVTGSPLVAYLVADNSELAFEGGLASIASADFFNYVPYYTFGLVGFFYLVLHGRVRSGLYGYLLGFLLLSVSIAVIVYVVTLRRSLVEATLVRASGALHRTIGRLSGRLRATFEPATVRRRLSGFYEMLDRFGAHRRSVVVSIVYAHVGMAFLIVPVYTTALSLDAHVPFLLVALVVALSKIGALFPAPGGLGGIEVTIAAVLYLLGGLDAVTATAVALLYRLCTYWFTVGLGGVTTLVLSIRYPSDRAHDPGP